MNRGLSLVENDATGNICSWTRRILFEQGRHRASEGSHGLGYSYHDTRRAPREYLSGSGSIFRILHPVYDPARTFVHVRSGGFGHLRWTWWAQAIPRVGCSGELTAESKAMLPRVCSLCRVVSTVVIGSEERYRSLGLIEK
jgi:hypothetical protein